MQYFSDEEFKYQSNVTKLVSDFDHMFDILIQAMESKNLKVINMSCKPIVDICNKIMNIKAPNKFKSIQANMNFGCMIFKKIFEELPYKIFEQNWRQNFLNEMSKGKKYFEKAHMEMGKMKAKLEKVMRRLV